MTNRPLKLLIVTTVAHARDSLTAYFQLQADVTVVGTAADAAGALRLTEQLQPDVVLMDTTLPDRDGFTTARQLHDQLPSTAVILLTVHQAIEDIERASAAGAWACIEKSAGIDPILATLERWVQTRAGQRSC